jgi:hypothetical protein
MPGPLMRDLSVLPNGDPTMFALLIFYSFMLRENKPTKFKPVRHNPTE